MYLPKNFRKFLKFRRDGKSFEKGKFSNFKKDKKDFKKKDSKDSSPSQMVKCFECKGHGHVKKECPTHLKVKGKVFATTLMTWMVSILIWKKVVTEKEIISHLWPLHPWTHQKI